MHNTVNSKCEVGRMYEQYQKTAIKNVQENCMKVSVY
jgi:hypothetical protein